MSNAKEATARVLQEEPQMNKDAVRKVLDAVKADKRTSLTAPEGKLVCDAYGIPVPKEGVAKSAAPWAFRW
jgi:acyl-CoA synthetase (NDP forming)